MRAKLLGLATAMILAAPALGADKTVCEVIADNDQFTTLTKAIKAAGLEPTLRGEGPFTLLAPTDEAFRRLPPGKLDELMRPENQAKLAGLLKLHVINDKVTSSQAMQLSGKAVPTACPEGTRCTIRASGGDVRFDCAGTTAKVVKPDIPASNGVIHAIDNVLVPQP